MGNPYLQVGKKTSARLYRSCWFSEDWEILRRLIHRVSLRTSPVSQEKPVRDDKFQLISVSAITREYFKLLQYKLRINV